MSRLPSPSVPPPRPRRQPLDDVGVFVHHLRADPVEEVEGIPFRCPQGTLAQRGQVAACGRDSIRKARLTARPWKDRMGWSNVSSAAAQQLGRRRPGSPLVHEQAVVGHGVAHQGLQRGLPPP